MHRRNGRVRRGGGDRLDEYQHAQHAADRDAASPGIVPHTRMPPSASGTVVMRQNGNIRIAPQGETVRSVYHPPISA